MQESSAVSKGARGGIYSAADRTLSELSGASLPQAVQLALQEERLTPWKEGRQRLMLAAAERAASDDTIGTMASVDRAITSLIAGGTKRFK